MPPPLGRVDSSGFVDVDSADQSSSYFRALVRAVTNRPHRRALVRNYWHAVLENPRSRRPPLVTLCYAIACVVVFYATESHGYPA